MSAELRIGQNYPRIELWDKQAAAWLEAKTNRLPAAAYLVRMRTACPSIYYADPVSGFTYWNMFVAPNDYGSDQSPSIVIDRVYWRSQSIN